jgi:hypothetical protein
MLRNITIVSLLSAVMVIACGSADLFAAERDDDVASLKASLADLRKALSNEKAAHAASKAAAAQAAALAQGNFDSLTASLNQLQRSLASNMALMKQFSDEKAALAKTANSANEAARGLKRNFDAASVQIRRLENMTKHYALLIKDLRAENQELQSQLRKKNPALARKNNQAPAADPRRELSGKIVDATRLVASINIGRTKGVKKDMVFKVFRGDKFIAHLRIDLAEPKSAAGMIIGKNIQLLRGDKVVLEPSKPDKAPATSPAKIAPQTKPVSAWLQAVRTGDKAQLKTVFSQRMQIRHAEMGWDKVMKAYQNVFKEEFGDYKLENFTFEFEGNEQTGKVSIVRKGKKLPGLRVIKEGSDWKVNER